MAEELFIPETSDRVEIYNSLLPQISALLQGESDFIANSSNFTAALKQAFGFLWVGFYFVKNEELVLGPFQGPIACTRIKKGKGVCGTAWKNEETIVVPDVNAFPGHIACSSASQSEIVIPIRNKEGIIFGVLDVDSEKLNDFSDVDKIHLEKLTKILGDIYAG
jgi:L-methionine (R)-S-oxide reductase